MTQQHDVVVSHPELPHVPRELLNPELRRGATPAQPAQAADVVVDTDIDRLALCAAVQIREQAPPGSVARAAQPVHSDHHGAPLARPGVEVERPRVERPRTETRLRKPVDQDASRAKEDATVPACLPEAHRLQVAGRAYRCRSGSQVDVRDDSSHRQPRRSDRLPPAKRRAQQVGALPTDLEKRHLQRLVPPARHSGRSATSGMTGHRASSSDVGCCRQHAARGAYGTSAGTGR